MSRVLGLRAKTGRAIAVVIAKGPAFVARREIELFDPSMPATAEPYHQFMELEWERAAVAVQPLAEAIERVAVAALATLIADYDVRRIAVVGAPERQLEKIGNEHIRAHAAEGVLFRHVLEVAARVNHVKCTTFHTVDTKPFTRALKTLGSAAGPPWRADEKAAATAALLVL
jgi:hypothetical protein